MRFDVSNSLGVDAGNALASVRGGSLRDQLFDESKIFVEQFLGLRAGRDGCAPLRGCAGAFFFSPPFPKNSATRCQKVFFWVFAGACGPRKRS